MPALLKALGYDSAENFLSAEDAAAYGDSLYSHLCRRGKSNLGLQGVYFLGAGTSKAPTPVVAVCWVENEDKAREIHKLVWNQDFVPFVLVESPVAVRLYSGFQYAMPSGQDAETGLIEPIRDFNRISAILEGFRSEEIDAGLLWSKWGQHVDPKKRVDWHLLTNLGRLGKTLRSQKLAKSISHAFIGRYVYLRYLHDRGFLSERKLSRWKLEKAQIFSRDATLEAFTRLNANLDDATDGLNGAVFPFEAGTITQQHLTTVASAFCGDDPKSGQTVFSFAVYDFSYIPIETLSVIYEQFLHEADENQESVVKKRTAQSKGKEQGAYYTPIPLVNFLLAEMDARQPLVAGMKVLDPSCGSGAFLVQTYRMLIERAVRANGSKIIPPSELRAILTNQIFGLDRDTDACRIAEMSLIVTLLDYVDPPDLEGKYKSFRLPKLASKNIFEADFFDQEGDWQRALREKSNLAPFDWIVGNPPWKEITNPPKKSQDQKALNWMLAKDAPPIGGNQIAEAFVWKSCTYLKKGGVSGLVLPAMTLFKDESTAFRKRLFSQVNVWSVVNFANLNHVLFSGRTIVPVMTLFFENSTVSDYDGDPIITYAPLVLNQEANKPLRTGRQLDTWNLVINGSEVREIIRSDAVEGDALTWKLAMWGSYRDKKLLKHLTKFSSLENFCETHKLHCAEGFQLREDPNGISITQQDGKIIVVAVLATGPLEKAGIRVGDRITKIGGQNLLSLNHAIEMLGGKEGSKLVLPIVRNANNGVFEVELDFGGDKLAHHPDLEGKLELDFGLLKKCGRIANFPARALRSIPKSRCWLRIRGGLAGIPASTPPHIIVDVSRRFAVFRDDFVVVPARQIGISGIDLGQDALLRALSLLLTSDLCLYHQFFHSTQWGVEHSIATLRVLRKLPIPPIDNCVQEWAEIHKDIQSRTLAGAPMAPIDQAKINNLVFAAFGLHADERCLIEDFIRVNMLAIKGKVEQEAIRPPKPDELLEYLNTLRGALDDYMKDDSYPASHHITAVQDAKSVMIEIVLREGDAVSPVVKRAKEDESKEFLITRKNLLKQHRQWIYFNRDLRIYSEGRLHLFKPLQRIQWTHRQAVLDAGELIAEAIGN